MVLIAKCQDSTLHFDFVFCSESVSLSLESIIFGRSGNKQTLIFFSVWSHYFVLQESDHATPFIPLSKAHRNRQGKRDQEWLLLCNPAQMSVSVAKHWKRSQFQLIIIKAFPTLEAQRPGSKASWYLRGKDARATGPCEVRQANLLTLSEDRWGFIFFKRAKDIWRWLLCLYTNFMLEMQRKPQSEDDVLPPGGIFHCFSLPGAVCLLFQRS